MLLSPGSYLTVEEVADWVAHGIQLPPMAGALTCFDRVSPRVSPYVVLSLVLLRS
jgi:hypothetical protein